MSAAQTVPTLRSRLEALQCHFTWDLDRTRSKLFCLRDDLEDIGDVEGYSWLGHIYNLQGFVQYHLGSPDQAGRFFLRAAEAFRQMRNTVSEEGPWLVVNYGNRAWLHHLRGEEAESRALLSKVDALTSEHPPPAPAPSRDELHPEVCAEKAWTLMKFSRDQRLQAVGLFERAVELQRDRVEWQTSHALVLANTSKNGGKPPGPDVVEKMRVARERDPDNSYLAALHLQARAAAGQKVEAEARELARDVLRKPASSYSGIRPLLRLYRTHVSADEAIDLAEEALERHPDERYLKLCAAICYRMKIFLEGDSPLEHSVVSRAVRLAREVVALYPDSSLDKRISLADLLAKSEHSRAEADQIYEDLLQSDLDPRERQRLYNGYAKHLHYVRREIHESIRYHMRAAALPYESHDRQHSISLLQRVRERNRNRMCGEIQEFLDNLQN